MQSMQLGSVKRILLGDGQWHVVEGLVLSDGVQVKGPGGPQQLKEHFLSCTINGIQTLMPWRSVQAFQYEGPESDRVPMKLV